MVTRPETRLVDVFVECRLGPVEPVAGPPPVSARLEPCLDLYGVRRERSYLARDGRRILCHFHAPDAESLRMALRVSGTEYDALWTGAVTDLPGAAEIVLIAARSFERPLGAGQERRCRARMARRLLDLGMEPARVLLSRCRRRLLWLCRTRGPDAAMPAVADLARHGFDVWSCDAVAPAHLEMAMAKRSVDSTPGHTPGVTAPTRG